MDGLTTSQHVAQAACAAFVAVAALLLGVEQVVNDSKGGDGGGDQSDCEQGESFIATSH